MSILKIANGTVYDPANGVDGVVMDVWIRDGKVVAPPLGAGRPSRQGPRRHRPGRHARRRRHARPHRRAEGQPRPQDAARGQTQGRRRPPHAADPLRHHRQRAQHLRHRLPLRRHGLHHRLRRRHPAARRPPRPRGVPRHAAHRQGLLRPVRQQPLRPAARSPTSEPERLRAFVGWLLGAAKGYAVKLVNPGGVEEWKERRRQHPRPRRSRSSTSTSPPRQIITDLAQTAMDLGLPHPVHIHCNNLGLPGNWKTTLATMQALEGRRAHLTHIQFHSYGGEPDDQGTFCSQVPALADYVNAHPNLTVDVGQVLFGETTSMTGDGPLGYYLHKVTGRKWTNADTEMEAGCGIVPDHLQGEEPRPRPAMGDRPGVVSARQGSLARRHEHRPPQRRLLPGLSRDRPAADGPHLSAGGAEARAIRACWSARVLKDLDREYTLVRDRHHHASRPGPHAWADAQGPSRRRGRRAT